MNSLILDTYPNLCEPILAQSDNGDSVWVMDREKASTVYLPRNVDHICFAHAFCDDKLTHHLVQSFRQQDFKGQICIATEDGQTPHGLMDVETVHPQNIQTRTLVHYHEHTQAILGNGLTLTDDQPLFLQRPERLYIDESTSLKSVLSHLENFVQLSNDTPSSRTLKTEGVQLFRPQERTRGWIQALLSSPMNWRASTFRGDGSPIDLITTLRAILSYQIRHPKRPNVRFEIQEVQDPLLTEVLSLLHAKPVTGEQLQRLHEQWRKHPELWFEGTLRMLDDTARELIFHHLPQQGKREGSSVATYARQVLGSPEAWIGTYHRILRQGTAQVCLIPTRPCVPPSLDSTLTKQSVRMMSEQTAKRSVELLLSAPGAEINLHFSGGEPFLEWPLIQSVTQFAHEQAEKQGRKIRFRFTTNAHSLQERQLDTLKRYDCHFQWVFNGEQATQKTKHKPWKTGNAYPALQRAWFTDRELSHDVSCIIHPTNVTQMVDNLCHIWDLGYTQIHLTYATDANWDESATLAWTQALHTLGKELKQRWAQGQNISLINFAESRKKARVNLDLTVDWDGQIYGRHDGLYLEKERVRFHLGHLDEKQSYTRYLTEGYRNADLVEGWNRTSSVQKTQTIGAILNRFCDAMNPPNSLF